jgi:putative peptide zinc metalloprotease protein
MQYTLKTITENASDRYLLCDDQQNYYTISKLLYEILEEYKNTGSFAAVCNTLNNRNVGQTFTEEFVQNSVGKALQAINSAPAAAEQKRKSYIRHRFPIIREGGSIGAYRVLGFLFNRWVFGLLVTLSVVVTLFFFYTNGLTGIRTIHTRLTAPLSVKNMIICYIAFLFIIFIHEMGHATATYRFGVKPREIGGGFYFIFPVLYTNVSNIWILDARKRSIVNLGGIYFQLLINVLLAMLIKAGLVGQLGPTMLIMNTFSILVAFNPFFRYDGYWLFSDFFKISNLRKTSGDFMRGLLFHPATLGKYVLAKKIPITLIAYSLCNTFFWIGIYTVVLKYVVTGIPGITQTLSSGKLSFDQSLLWLVLKILTLSWLLVVLVTSFINLINYFYHGKHKRVYRWQE